MFFSKQFNHEVNLAELNLSKPTSIPELYCKHREHHSHKFFDYDLLRIDQESLAILPIAQSEVFSHVFTRFAFGYEAALLAIPHLAAFSKLRSHQNNPENQENAGMEIYAYLFEDTKKLLELSKTYLQENFKQEHDPKALTTNFRNIFEKLLPTLTYDLLATSNLPRLDQIRAEVKLRTVYHIIGEGLGSISGIWGLREAIKQVSQDTGKTLPAISNILDLATLIQRRNLAFGLSEIRSLAEEQYFATVLTLLRELKLVAPVLEKMRDETFTRWGSTFPFDIDQKELATAARSRVLSWLIKTIIPRPIKLSTFERLL